MVCVSRLLAWATTYRTKSFQSRSSLHSRRAGTQWSPRSIMPRISPTATRLSLVFDSTRAGSMTRTRHCSRARQARRRDQSVSSVASPVTSGIVRTTIEKKRGRTAAADRERGGMRREGVGRQRRRRTRRLWRPRNQTVARSTHLRCSRTWTIWTRTRLRSQRALQLMPGFQIRPQRCMSRAGVPTSPLTSPPQVAPSRVPASCLSSELATSISSSSTKVAKPLSSSVALFTPPQSLTI